MNVVFDTQIYILSIIKANESLIFIQAWRFDFRLEQIFATAKSCLKKRYILAAKVTPK